MKGNEMNVKEPEALSNDLARMSATVSRSLAEQTEAFLAQHLDKIGTHTLCQYPERSRRDAKDPNVMWFERLICLAPSDYQDPMTEETAKQQHPHATLVWALRLPVKEGR
jgi:hypothetical protein